MNSIHSFSAFNLNQLSLELNSLKLKEKEPLLAIIFSSYTFNLEGIIKEFSIFPDIEIFGASTCGEFLFNKEQNAINEESIVVSLFFGSRNWFRFSLFDGSGLSSFELGQKLGEFGKNSFDKFALMLVCSGLSTNGQEVVEGALSLTSPDLKMYGGLAGDDARFSETYVFSKNTILTNGVAVLAINLDLVDVDGIASSGWIGIGSDLVVTKSEGNIVYTIDNQPALSIYTEYLNVNDKDLPEIGVEYPLLVKRDGKEVLRAVMSVDREKKSLQFAGSIPEGSIVNFSSSPGFEVIDQTRREVALFSEHSPKAHILLLFSCMARHRALGMTIFEEIESIYSSWKVPLIGFFTYGEIGTHLSQTCDFYNETCALVKFRFLENS